VTEEERLKKKAEMKARLLKKLAEPSEPVTGPINPRLSEPIAIGFSDVTSRLLKEAEAEEDET